MTINLTQHIGTPEQGVTEPQDKAAVQRLLTFESLPLAAEIADRADALAQLAYDEFPSSELTDMHAMIGGAPYLMAPLEAALRARGITPVYAFSVRESVDQAMPDGTIKKVATFRHTGFVAA